MKEEKVWFENSKGQKLCGLLALQDHKAPSILFVHGMMPRTDKHEYGLFDELSQFLFNKGFSIFRFDFHAHGESEGEYKNVRVKQEVDDLKKAIDFFMGQAIDNNNIGILSTSFGVASTTLLNDARIKTIQLVCPAVHLNKVNMPVFDKHVGKNWKEQFQEKGFVKVLDEGLEERKQYIGVDFWNDIQKLDFTEVIKKVSKPLSIIAGDSDDYIKLEDTKELYNSANEPKELHVIKGGDHGCDNKKEELFKLILQWFNKWLK
ncbi:MAG: alpha/beta hydrolase [Candidatus Woesearchaeota archaeon]|nr:MAG: alpha/beta hydrolase [Candidatus Woesearchaeota archaeon]